MGILKGHIKEGKRSAELWLFDLINLSDQQRPIAEYHCQF